MKKSIGLAAITMLFCITPLSVAHAGSGVDGMDLDLSPYVGVGIGAFGLEYKDSTGSQNNTVFGGYGKVGIDIGYYLGAELRVGMTGTGTTAQTDGVFGGAAGDNKLTSDYFISYLGKIQVPVTAELTPYALIGATTVKFKDTAAGKAASSQTATGFSYGFGADYNLGNHLSINGEWMQYLTNVSLGNFQTAFGSTSSKAKMWGATASLNCHF